MTLFQNNLQIYLNPVCQSGNWTHIWTIHTI